MRRLAAAALLALAASCANASEGTAPESTAPDNTAPTAVVTTPAVDPTASSTAISTTSTAPAACPSEADVPAPEQAATGSRQVADLDDDGIDDTIIVRPGIEGAPTTVTVAFGRGGAASLSIADADPFVEVRSLGTVPLSEDGDSTHLAVALGGGAYTQSVGFVAVRECSLIRLTFDDGVPAQFLTGASVANALGVFCGEGVVEQFEFSLSPDSGDELRYDGAFTAYRLEGDTFVPGDRNRSTLSADELASVDLFACGSLTL